MLGAASSAFTTRPTIRATVCYSSPNAFRMRPSTAACWPDMPVSARRATLDKESHAAWRASRQQHGVSCDTHGALQGVNDIRRSDNPGLALRGRVAACGSSCQGVALRSAETLPPHHKPRYIHMYVMPRARDMAARCLLVVAWECAHLNHASHRHPSRLTAAARRVYYC